MSIDQTTRDWIRNEGDERAASAGCSFDVARASWTVWWIERYCRLYEGEGYAGQPVVLHGCHDCDHSEFYATTEDFWLDDSCTVPGPGQELLLERARLYSECVKNGHRVDWQYECHMRIYGWVKWRAKWKRNCRRFRQASIWIPKKQKKSPTLAANGMYLLAGDGEPGQKVFLAAKDGDQARKNAAKHTVEMLYQCPELFDKEAPRGGICTLNRSTLQITHEPSRSVMYPLSSSNASTQKSKEGLNGSILIDETHVVDRAFVDIISRAGISRSEPLFMEFSTAGNNPDGYGKERFDYTADVLAGRKVDEELFGAIYAAPQDVTDEELDTDFDRIANIANPSMGHTIDPDEIKADYERSKGKIENLANFKMYRLNVWQHSSNPWLRPSDWAKCAAAYNEDDLLGKDCFIAFDLALKWDTACIMLAFPWGEGGLPRYRLWPYFFLPEYSARATADKVSWQDWKAKGFINLTGGNTTDFPLIRATINQAVQKFNVLGPLAFDRKFAEYLAQELQDEDGIECEEFPQSPTHFLEPMELFDAAVTDGRIEHPDNAVLNWQAGNATKDQKNGMLIKPRGEPVKKIDGIVAAVMAVGRAATAEVSIGWSKDDGVCL
jgi:phage terminase large subunit-like protein